MAAKLPFSARIGEFMQEHAEDIAKIARQWRAQQLADEERIVRWVTASANEALERLGDDDDDEKRREAITFYLKEFEALANSMHRETALGAAEAAFAIVTLGAPIDKEIILEVFQRWAQKGRAKRAKNRANNAKEVKDIIRSIDPEQRMKPQELKKKLVAPLAKKGIEMPGDKTLYNYRKQIKSVDK